MESNIYLNIEHLIFHLLKWNLKITGTFGPEGDECPFQYL